MPDRVEAPSRGRGTRRSKTTPPLTVLIARSRSRPASYQYSSRCGTGRSAPDERVTTVSFVTSLVMTACSTGPSPPPRARAPPARCRARAKAQRPREPPRPRSRKRRRARARRVSAWFGCVATIASAIASRSTSSRRSSTTSRSGPSLTVVSQRSRSASSPRANRILQPLARPDLGRDLGEREPAQQLHHDNVRWCLGRPDRISYSRRELAVRTSSSAVDSLVRSISRSDACCCRVAARDPPGAAARRCTATRARAGAGLEVAETLSGIGEHRLGDVFGLEVVGRSAADVAKELRIVATKRFLGAVRHPLHSRSERRKVTVTRGWFPVLQEKGGTDR